MTYAGTFLKKHGVFFESVFQPQERVIYIEKLSQRDSWIFGGICAVIALFFFSIISICICIQSFYWLVALLFCAFLCIVLLFYSSGLFSQATLVLTSHAFYYCRGADCSIVFECRFASIAEIKVTRKEILIWSNETYEHYIGPFCFPFCAPISGRWNFLKNRWLSLAKKQTESKLFSFKKLGRLAYHSFPAHYFLDMPLLKGSEAVRYISDVLSNNPKIKLNVLV